MTEERFVERCPHNMVIEQGCPACQEVEIRKQINEHGSNPELRAQLRVARRSVQEKVVSGEIDRRTLLAPELQVALTMFERGLDGLGVEGERRDRIMAWFFDTLGSRVLSVVHEGVQYSDAAMAETIREDLELIAHDDNKIFNTRRMAAPS